LVGCAFGIRANLPGPAAVRVALLCFLLFARLADSRGRFRPLRGVDLPLLVRPLLANAVRFGPCRLSQRRACDASDHAHGHPRHVTLDAGNPAQESLVDLVPDETLRY
jgi:hypothetical protein